MTMNSELKFIYHHFHLDGESMNSKALGRINSDCKFSSRSLIDFSSAFRYVDISYDVGGKRMNRFTKLHGHFVTLSVSIDLFLLGLFMNFLSGFRNDFHPHPHIFKIKT